MRYVSRPAVTGTRSRSRPAALVDRRNVVSSPSYNKSSSGSKYTRHAGRSGVVEHFFGPPDAKDDAENVDVAPDRPRRKTKHTIVTREARLGIDRVRRIEERQRPAGRCSPNYVDACECSDSSIFSVDELQVLVSYSGSVEMPSDAPRLAGSRLQSIRSAVQRLRASHRKRLLVVMDISAESIRLTDASFRTVACYVTDRIAFCGICPDDRRFFGIVMTSANNEAALRADSTVNSSCHVFMVDPELSDHHVHTPTAARFGLNCTMDLDTDRCLEFPESAAPIIGFLGCLYRQRKNAISALAPMNGPFFDSNNIRRVCDGREQNDRVCVVDVPRHGGSSQGRSDADGDSFDESFIHDLSAIHPVPPKELEPDDMFCQTHPPYKHANQHSLAASKLPSGSQIVNDQLGHRTVSNAFQRSTGGLDDMNNADSLRRSLRRFLAPNDCRKQLSKQQAHGGMSDDDAESTSSVQSSGRSSTVSPSPFLPPPPLPPRQNMTRSDSDAGMLPVRPVADTRHLMSLSNVKLTPALARKSDDSLEHQVPLTYSASKPPLPERRPIVSKPGQKYTVPSAHRKEVPDRPKSTPPVDMLHELSLAVPLETTNYDSDPGERANDEQQSLDKDGNLGHHGSERFLSNAQASDDCSGDSRDNGGGIVTAVSCKVLTNIGVDHSNVGRAASWALHFDRLLADGAGRATFGEFLRSEFSAENLLFFTKCEEYKQLTEVEQRRTLAAEVVTSHFAENASDPVNVDGIIRHDVLHDMAAAAPELFDVAQKQIYLLMKQDSYVRFLKSDIYKQAVIAEMEGRPLPHSGTSLSATKADSDARKSMKKSRSSATAADETSQEKRRKSLLPWSRNKSDKKFGKNSRNVHSQKKRQSMIVSGSVSSGSNSMLNEISDGDLMCKVIFPDGSENVVHFNAGQTVEMVLSKLHNRLEMGIDLFDVVLVENEQMIHLSEDAVLVVTSKDIRLERCVIFRLDLPGCRLVAVRARANRPLSDVVNPILTRYSINIDGVIMHIAGTGVILADDTPVASLDGKHILVQNLDEVKGKRRKDGILSGGRSSLTRQKSSIPANSPTAAEILRSLFNGVDTRINFNGYSFDDLGVWLPDKGVDVKSKSEDGRHSGLFSFMRRNSLGDRKTNTTPNAATQPVAASSASDVSVQARNQQNNDERKLFELLKRVQNRQYDDQRGTSLNAFKEMPDFLRPPTDDSATGDEEIVEKCANDSCENRVEVCRRADRGFDVAEVDFNTRLSVSPSLSLHPTATFSDEEDSIVPSHENAQLYFSQNSNVPLSPDFTNPRLMEGSLRDIGMDSPACKSSSVRGGWTLIGNIASNPRQSVTSKMTVVNKDDGVFAVPSLPPRRAYRCQVTPDNSMHHLLVPAESSYLESPSQPSSLVLDSAATSNCNTVHYLQVSQRPLGTLSTNSSILSSSSSTPSPTTHDLILVDGDCNVAKAEHVTKARTKNNTLGLAPLVDSEDSDECYGIV